jgi:tRNA(fMet)-specific endonuclease VapC
VRYLADTDYLIDASGGIPAAVRTLDRLSDAGVAVSIVSLGELFEGAYGFPDPPRLLAGYRQFLATYPVLPLTDPIMDGFAATRAHLRRTGLLIPDFDLAIAATAIHHGLTLVTRNLRHFSRLPELKLYQPS